MTFFNKKIEIQTNKTDSYNIRHYLDVRSIYFIVY